MRPVVPSWVSSQLHSGALVCLSPAISWSRLGPKMNCTCQQPLCGETTSGSSAFPAAITEGDASSVVVLFKTNSNITSVCNWPSSLLLWESRSNFYFFCCNHRFHHHSASELLRLRRKSSVRGLFLFDLTSCLPLPPPNLVGWRGNGRCVSHWESEYIVVIWMGVLFWRWINRRKGGGVSGTSTRGNDLGVELSYTLPQSLGGSGVGAIHPSTNLRLMFGAKFERSYMYHLLLILKPSFRKCLNTNRRNIFCISQHQEYVFFLQSMWWKKNHCIFTQAATAQEAACSDRRSVTSYDFMWWRVNNLWKCEVGGDRRAAPGTKQ